MKKTNEDKKVIPVIQKHKKALSKLESLFNYRIKRVKRLKDEIKIAEGQIIEYQEKWRTRVIPIGEETLEAQCTLIKALVEAYDAKVLKGKKQKQKFEDIMLYFLKDLIFEKGQEGLDEIYQRFAEESVEETQNQREEDEKQQMIDMLRFAGLEINEEEEQKIFDGDVDSDFLESFTEKIEGLDNFFSDHTPDDFKTEKQIEREKQQAEELANISKTVKKVYKELTKELHPDKETDEAKQAEKTILMQEVTEAYRNDDLFTLLSIQLSQIEGADNSNLSQDKINYFNTMLLNQARELEEQKRDMIEEIGISADYSKKLGKKQFMTFMREVIETERYHSTVKLKQVKEQIKNVQSLNKKYIKEFVEENHDVIFNRLNLFEALFN